MSSGNSARSVLVWVRNGRTGNQDQRLGWLIFTQGVMENNQMWSIGVRTDNGLFLWGHNHDYSTGANSGYFPTGEWHHFAVTWSGSALTFYYDGVAVAASVRGQHSEFNTGATAVYGGSSESTPRSDCVPHFCWFLGNASHLRVFNSTALTSDQVRGYMDMDRPPSP